MGRRDASAKNNHPFARSMVRSQDVFLNAGMPLFQKRVQEIGKYSKTVYLMATGYLLSVVVARTGSDVNYKTININSWHAV